MKFSKSWLQDYSKEPLPEVKKLEEIVTFNAFEIEEVTKFGDDDILDIKVLPNRAHDALGHRGMARDITALLGNTFIDPNEFYQAEGDASVAAPLITIVDAKACTRFMSVRIDGVRVTESPEWLKVRLQSIGQKSINSIVDITNYVQFAINKPMHAYDSTLLAGNTLSARFAHIGETLTTLDDKDLTLDEDTLVIADTEKPLGLAGIKGGKFSGISAATTSIVIESANFNPTRIRKTAQKYGIRTDASKRFENEISDTLVEDGLRMTISLVQKLNEGVRVSAIVDVYPSPTVIATVSVPLSHINGALGTTYNGEDIEKVFTALGFVYTTTGENYSVTVPSERLDIRIKEDLIEEVARVKGLSSIVGVLPMLNRTGLPHKRLYYENKVKNILYANGFSEIMTYSFGDVGEVEIVKGLATDKEKLRSALASGVERAFHMNMLNAPLLNIQTVKMYEFGNVFTKITERRHLALVIDDGKKKSSFTDEVDTILSQIKRDLGVATIEYETVSAKPYVIELDFDTLIATLPEPTSYESLTRSQNSIAYTPISPYPFIVRDIAVWVPASVTWEDLHTLALQIDSPLIIRIDCFDTFSKTAEDGSVKTSFAFRFVLQSKERTLTDEEANAVAEKMYTILKEKGYEIR
ncbi:MAG: phenylalanine--tRNA ligase subunit beta [Candidatus Paceibacterota bacterium]